MADKVLNSLDFGTGDVYHPLPIVNTSDSGKVLAVGSDGTWGAAENEGGSSVQLITWGVDD